MTRYLFPVAIAEGGLVVVLIFVLFLHGLRLRVRDQADRRRADSVRQALVGLAEGRSIDHDRLEQFFRLPSRLALALVDSFFLSLGGAYRQNLDLAAQLAGLPAHAARLCGSRSRYARLEGIRLATRLRHGNDHPERLLGDRYPLVRAEAVRWVGVMRDARWSRPVAQMLGDPSPLVRFAAGESLLELGAAAVEPLLNCLATATDTRLAEALDVASHLEDSRLVTAALASATDANPRVRSAAGAVLVTGADETAQAALGSLLADPDPTVKAATARQVGRAGLWRLAPMVAGQLADPDGEVQRSAAQALTHLGTPGEMLLRMAAAAAGRAAAGRGLPGLDQGPVANR